MDTRIEVDLGAPADCGADDGAGIGNVRFGVGVGIDDGNITRLKTFEQR